MLEIIQKWLAKPSGRYFDGLAIFLQLASPAIKNKYEKYFSEVKEEPGQFDIHFTMLVNKVAAIESAVKLNPKTYEDIKLVLKVTGPDAETQALLDAKNAEIAEQKAKAEQKAAEVDALKAKLELLKSENVDVTDENEELSEKIEDLESELEDAQDEVSGYEEKLNALVAEVAELKAKRGIQIIPFKDMPEDLQKLYTRVREITPLMANIHAQISVAGLHAATRKKLVKQLCDYDDERRANWDKINDWSEGKTVTEVPEQVEEPAYDADPLIAGAQMLRRVDRLNENIKRSQDVADTTDKETIKANALKRIEAYTVELEELKAKLTPAKKEGDAE